MKSEATALNLATLITSAKERAAFKPELVTELFARVQNDNTTKSALKRDFPLRPSSAMKSMRDLYYGLINFNKPGTIPIDPIPGRNCMLLNLGHVIEGHLVEYLKVAQFEIIFRNVRVNYGKIIDKDTGEEFPLSGEIDFGIQEVNEVILCDSKSSADYPFKAKDKITGKDKLPKEEHIAQMQLYMHSDWGRTNNVKEARLLYYNKNTSDVKCAVVKYEPEIALAILEKFERVYAFFKRGELPPREHVLGQDWQADYSNYRTYENSEFTVVKALRKRVELTDTESVTKFKEFSPKDAVRFIATAFGNAVLDVGGVDHWLELSVDEKALILRKLTHG